MNVHGLNDLSRVHALLFEHHYSSDQQIVLGIILKTGYLNNQTYDF